MKVITERISHFRKKNNLSQTELGEQMQEITGQLFTRSVVSNYENGRRKIPVDLIPVLAKIFGITTDELFYSREDMEKSHEYSSSISELQELAHSDVKAAFEKSLIMLRENSNQLKELQEQLKNSEEEVHKYQKKVEVMINASDKLADTIIELKRAARE
ncbi:helix-turn-helix transcriptional regulator [Fulvivirga sp. 29W222]|uniref:Helix-turn-helix transcriptional regulator n=1 Tax=Fulvivirga marina TaxID=2494733 RepID=A0A937FYF0_9BACT|nr:helix-turn-helix transcriptional regulator [Fulvivirga marina]MBL6447283.1 helix-turn-helix transcriptional regulator [Fulvivirga marina]